MNRHSARRAASSATHRARGGIRSFLVFVVTLAILAAAVWGGWTFMNRGGLPSLPFADGGDRGGGNPVTVGVTGEAPQSLDIRTDASDAVEQALIANVYETLTGRDQSNAVVPGLAASWQASADGLTYTFRLNAGMRFSNGDALDASDVVWSLQQTVQNRYVTADRLTGLASVSNPDASTVVIAMSSPNPALPWLLSGRAGVVYDKDANVDYATAALGSGPFTVDSFRRGESITLKRNPRYWNADARAASPSVTLRYFQDGGLAATALAKGETDATVAVPASALDTLRTHDDIALSQGESTHKVMLGYNARAQSIFSEVHLRQGLRYVIDRQRIIDADGAAEAIGGPIPKLDPGYEDLTGLYPHDLAKAHSMLDYFGYRYRLRLVYPMRFGQRIGDQIADSLTTFGYTVSVQTVDDATWQRQVVEDHDFDMTIFSMDGSHDVTELADPDMFLGYTDSQSDQLLRDVKAAKDDASYQTALKALGRRLSENSIADFLYVERPWNASRNGVTGLPLNRNDVFLPLAGLAKA